MKRISPIRGRQSDGPALLELKTSLQETQSALSSAYTAFDYASDPELTEACIFDCHFSRRQVDVSHFP